VLAGPRTKMAAPAGAPPKAGRDRARPQPRSAFRPAPAQANTKKGQEPSPAPALEWSSVFVQHGPMDRVHHADGEMRRQCVVVTLV
jgi:hypothetical protein